MADVLEEVLTTAPRPTRSGASMFTGSAYFDEIGGFNFEAANLSALRNTQIANITVADVIDASDETAEAIARGERALANAYTTRILDSFLPDATDAAENALRNGALPADIARQLAAREVLDGQSFGATRAVEAVNAALQRLDLVQVAATRALPEAVATAGRVVGGVPFGLGSLIVEGAIGLGSYLSDLALRNAIDRITGPAVADAPPDRAPPVAPAAPPEFGPETQPEVDVPARRPPAPAPFRDPLTPLDGPLLDPLSGVFRTPTVNPAPSSSTPAPVPTPSRPTVPNLLTDPMTLAPPIAPPADLQTPDLFTLAPPLPTTGTSAPPSVLTLPSPFGPNIPDAGAPNNTRRCDCPQPQKKKRKKKPRDVCYRGTYVEKRSGLIKFRKEEIPCQ